MPESDLPRSPTALNALKHGQSSTAVYRIFTGMCSRCTNPNNKAYPDYGGRGIKVGYADFSAFVADVGPRPAGYCIDRRNNEKGYEPGNCAWVPTAINQLNKRDSKVWIVDGVEFESSVAAAQALGIDASMVNRRCNGYTSRGKAYPPRPGWSCRLKYPEQAHESTEAAS